MKHFPDTTIIAGNVGSVRGAQDLVEWGAKIIKVGIGPGKSCTTKLKTGFYTPMFSTIRAIKDNLYNKNCFIIADEMQNATPNQCKMLMTRIGEGSKIVITGDIEQADRVKGNNGLADLCERLKEGGVKGIAVCDLDNRDIQRHRIIDSVLTLYS